MAQDIQLQQVMVDGVIVKMGGDDIRTGIICRVLHRRKGVDVLPVGQDDDSSRVLAGTAADAGTSLHDPIDLAVPFALPPLLVIVFHIAKRGLVRQSGNGPRPEGLSGAEDHFRIFVGAALVIPGEIQVDIRLLVPFKSQEGLEGNVKSVFCQHFPAHRALFVRHIPAAAAGVCFHFL